LANDLNQPEGCHSESSPISFRIVHRSINIHPLVSSIFAANSVIRAASAVVSTRKMSSEGLASDLQTPGGGVGAWMRFWSESGL